MPEACSDCGRILCVQLKGDDFCATTSCECFFCPLCAMRLVAIRFKTPKCPSCSKNINEFVYLASDRQTVSEGESVEITNKEPDLLMDPVRFYTQDFKQQPQDDKDRRFVLSISYPDRVGGEWRSSALSVVLDRDVGPETDEDEDDLRKIFAILHIPLFNMNKALFKDVEFLSRMTPGEYVEYAVYDDPSLLLRLLYAFGTGEINLDVDLVRTHRGYKSTFMAVAVAKDMLQRINLAKPGPFQIMMANQLETMRANDDDRNFFSQMRLAASPTFMRNVSLRQQAERFDENFVPDPFSMETRHFDNGGFKGRKKKWSQHTIIQRKDISVEQLIEDGFYTKGKLSRKRTSFDEFARKEADIDMRYVKEEEDCIIDGLEKLAERVVSPTEEDKAILSKRVLESIECAIGLSLPDRKKCIKMKRMSKIYWKDPIPLNLGTKIQDPPRAEPITRVVKQTQAKCAGMAGESKEQLVFGQPTLYEMNNISLEKPWHKDPNATETVEELMKFMEKTSNWDREKLDLERTGGMPPLRDLFAVATCDGSPMKRFLDIMSKDIRESGGDHNHRKFKNVQFFMGGMHYLMQFANMSNRLSWDYLNYFVSAWRPTEPQQNWLLCVSDPTDYVLEMPEYILAHYRAAADGLRSKYPKAPLTPASVHRHMLERAEEHPVCMAILLNLRFVEIALMIRDTEKSGEHGDVDLFLTTIRLALPVFTASHSVNYVHICCDFLEWWALASEAEKLFFRKYLFTQKSPLGKPVWVDKAIEWTMRHLRIFLGRYARPNQNQCVEKAVADIPFRMASKRDVRALSWRESNLDMYSSAAFNMQTVQLSKVFVETYLKAVDANLWGNGPLLGDFLYDENEIPDECSEAPFEFPINGTREQMSASYLSAYAIGEERLRNYYIEWHITNRHAASRAGVDRQLKLIPSQSSRRKKEIEEHRLVRLSTSVDELRDLKKLFPIQKIKEDLDQLRESHYPEIPESAGLGRREECLIELCKWRKQYFEDFPWILEEMEELADWDEFEDNQTDIESRQEALEHFIFSLHSDTVNNFG